MRLPHTIAGLRFKKLTSNLLILEIVTRRHLIRYARDQKGDNRCWLDWLLIWEMLDSTPPFPTRLPPRRKMLQHCRYFYENTNCDSPDPTPQNAILEKSRWDDDLGKMDHEQLFAELLVQQIGIKIHRDIPHRLRNIHHERRLYDLLPEGIPADFCLPPRDEFLGRAKSPCAGCPAFCDSWKRVRGSHNFTRWGPKASKAV